MRFGTPKRDQIEQPERALPEGVTQEELEFMNLPWFHGSPKAGIKKLRAGGSNIRRVLKGAREGVYLSLKPDIAGIHGKHISEWKLLRPLKIADGLSDMAFSWKIKDRARKEGYAGVYFRNGATATYDHALVFEGSDLEKIDEKKN